MLLLLQLGDPINELAHLGIPPFHLEEKLKIHQVHAFDHTAWLHVKLANVLFTGANVSPPVPHAVCIIANLTIATCAKRLGARKLLAVPHGEATWNPQWPSLLLGCGCGGFGFSPARWLLDQ